MNDERSGQLTADWTIPKYARENLWIETETTLVQVEGEFGLFELEAPASHVTLRWCGGDGPALTQLRWQADNLGWQGSVAVGGYVDSLHMMAVPGTDLPIIVLYVGGHPLKATTLPYLSDRERRKIPYPTPDFHTGLAAEISESVTTWIVEEDSPLATLVHDALLNNMRLYVFGQLADDSSGWGEHFALPLLLEAVTLFST